MRALQSFFFASLIAAGQSARADLSVGQIYSLKFIDVDKNTLLTSDGHVNVIVLAAPLNVPKAQMTGDHVPDYCLGNPTYRMITVVKFTKHRSPVRALLTAGVRRRLNAEAKRVQPRYDANKITRDPRREIFAVADFDGTTVSQLGAPPSVDFRAFVFGRNGELLGQWNNVPSAEELAVVLKKSD
ncbi:MAG: hypothetical protein ABI925_06970 [Verrucomicrobiota bacterium]